jgi:Uma2 family endonuclease
MLTMFLPDNREARYRGLRMTADDYLAAPDDGHRYELINGVVCMSPSPTPIHQEVVLEIGSQIRNHLTRRRVGRCFIDVDVRLTEALVYRPDVVFLSAERSAHCGARITVVPDLVVEVISPDSRRYDHETKKGDYERCGVGEYWLVDPEKREFVFYRLENGRYERAVVPGDTFASQIIPGFELDLRQVERVFG